MVIVHPDSGATGVSGVWKGEAGINGEQDGLKQHYSYRVYENPDVAVEFEAEKFGGPVGALFRRHQEQVISDFIGSPQGRKILDLGAGTGRISLPLCERGARVFAMDAAQPMIELLNEKAFLQGIPVRCVRGDAHALPFPDKYFDTVISLRMLMHVIDWKHALAEICRVADRHVIVDFPPVSGFAGLAPFVHPILRRLKSDHQSYKVFRIRTVVHALAQQGFKPMQIDRHIVFPFGFHRAVGSPAFTQKLEHVCKTTGLTDIFGAPVTILAERVP